MAVPRAAAVLTKAKVLVNKSLLADTRAASVVTREAWVVQEDTKEEVLAAVKNSAASKVDSAASKVDSAASKADSEDTRVDTRAEASVDLVDIRVEVLVVSRADLGALVVTKVVWEAPAATMKAWAAREDTKEVAEAVLVAGRCTSSKHLMTPSLF